MPLCGIKRVIGNSSMMMECNLLGNNDKFLNLTIYGCLHTAYSTGIGIKTFFYIYVFILNHLFLYLSENGKYKKLD